MYGLAISLASEAPITACDASNMKVSIADLV